MKTALEGTVEYFGHSYSPGNLCLLIFLVVYTFYFLYFLINGRLHQKPKNLHWHVAVNEAEGKVRSKNTVAIVHYRTANESYLLQVSAFDVLKIYISVLGPFGVCNRNLVDFRGLC